MSFPLLFLAALAVLLPEAIADATGGSASAWAYALYGMEAAFLWLLLAEHLPTSTQIEAFASRAVCAWGFFEAAQRAVFRLAFPMDHAPRLAPGQSLGEAATGLPMGLVSMFAALMLAALVQEAARGRP